MAETLSFLLKVFGASRDLFLAAAPYILFGLVVGGLLKVFLSASYVARHLGHGRFSSVVKAALLGIPMPLCSCGVLPAAASLKKQGANNGAVTAFLISTPESGVDSISITYALLDPIMTVARPAAAFVSAFVAGFTENWLHPPEQVMTSVPDLSCSVDGCCDGVDCSPEEHSHHHSFMQKIIFGMKYAATDIWGDLVGWFFMGIFLAGLITVLVPEEIFTVYLGGGLSSMLLMLVFGIPLYICATASTPIAAAFILKGVSPGAALVFLLVGPATNITSLSVLIGILGKRTTLIYLVSISVISVISGLILDRVYESLNISARAVAGQAAEILPGWFVLVCGGCILILSVKPMALLVQGWFSKKPSGGCGCSSGTCGDSHDDLVQIQPLVPGNKKKNKDAEM
jgi:uncharacterized membrane protein YraQ (UPF0718 family)